MTVCRANRSHVHCYLEIFNGLGPYALADRPDLSFSHDWVKLNMLAPCQVKAGDGSGLIQGSPFISNQESKGPLLTEYCFRISGCNASGRLNTDETGCRGASLHYAFDVVKLLPHSKACRSHCISPAWLTNGIQTEYSTGW